VIYNILPAGTGKIRYQFIENGTVGITYEQINLHNGSNIEGLRGGKAYIFYQPGDIHDLTLLQNLFSGILIRIGDLHHLQNPLISTFDFLSKIYKKTDRIALNTNPSLVPLFSYLFPCCDSLPISELTIQDGLREDSSVIVPNKLIRRSNGRVAYFGFIESAYHPRRTYWIHRLLDSNDGSRIDVLPALSPKDWLGCCSQYNAIVAPTLNGQWSHNLFVPNLAGSRIISDCLASPSYSYYTDYKTRYYRSCILKGSFLSFRSTVRKASQPHELEAGLIAYNARKFMETKQNTLNEFLRMPDSSLSVETESLLERAPASYSLILSVANIFEVTQEIIRLFVVYDMFLLSCPSDVVFKLLSMYFPHPRLLVRRDASINTFSSHTTYVELMGLNNEIGRNDSLLRLDIVLYPYDESLMQLSSRTFEPSNLSMYTFLLNQVCSTVAPDYKPAEFPQKLLNSVTVKYF